MGISCFTYSVLQRRGSSGINAAQSLSLLSFSSLSLTASQRDVNVFLSFCSIITCLYSFHPPLHLLSKEQVIHTNSQLSVLRDFETTKQFLETEQIIRSKSSYGNKPENLIVYLFADTTWFDNLLPNAVHFVHCKCGLGGVKETLMLTKDTFI